jgi:hypothetical protein
VTERGVEIYVGDAEEPTLTLAPPLRHALTAQGVWSSLNGSAGLMIDEFESEQIPVARLERLARACRDAAGGFGDDDTPRGTTVRKVRREGPNVVADDRTWVATPRVLRAALLELADLADTTRAEGQSLQIVLP